MLTLETLSELDAYVGRALGTGEWLTITQNMIDSFAEATDDHQWIHVDAGRAAREMPGGKTVAHGYLTFSLLPALGRSIFRVVRRTRGVNYGINRARFISPVPAGCRIRLHQKLKAADLVEGGRRLTFEAEVEVEGQSKPAMVAETISIIYD